MITKTILKAVVLINVALLAVACQMAPESKPLPKALRHSSVVSTSARTFAPQPGTRISWRGDIVVHAPDNTPRDPQQLAYIREQIETQLQQKGYQLVATGQTADFQLQGLIVLGNELNETSLRGILGFEPGLVASGTPYEKGSLLLMLLNPVTQDTEWRSVVQIFNAPDLEPALRQEQLRFGVSSLLRPLPDINVAP